MKTYISPLLLFIVFNCAGETSEDPAADNGWTCEVYAKINLPAALNICDATTFEACMSQAPSRYEANIVLDSMRQAGGCEGSPGVWTNESVAEALLAVDDGPWIAICYRF